MLTKSTTTPPPYMGIEFRNKQASQVLSFEHQGNGIVQVSLGVGTSGVVVDMPADFARQLGLFLMQLAPEENEASEAAPEASSNAT